MTRQMNKSSAIDNLAKSLKGKNRSDFRVVSQTRLSDTSIRVVGTYVNSMPEYQDLRDWAIANTEGKIRVIPETIMSFNSTAPYPMVAFVCEGNTERISEDVIGSMENMTRVTANSYLDTDLGETWTREDDGNFFTRANPDDIEKILSSKIKFIGPKTQNCARAVLSSLAQKDECVIYVRPNNELGIGIVANRQEEEFKIKDLVTQQVHDIVEAAVLHVVEGELDPAETKKVRDYLAQYLGKELAKKITT